MPYTSMRHELPPAATVVPFSRCTIPSADSGVRMRDSCGCATAGRPACVPFCPCAIRLALRKTWASDREPRRLGRELLRAQAGAEIGVAGPHPVRRTLGRDGDGDLRRWHVRVAF